MVQTRHKKIIAEILSITTLVSVVFYGINFPTARGATFTFTQGTWTAQTSNTAVHTSNQSGWTDFSAKDSGMASGTALSLAPSSSRTYLTGGQNFKIFCLNSTTCWAADGAGPTTASAKLIKKTTDGGATWTFAETPIDTWSYALGVTDIMFADANIGYAVYYFNSATSTVLLKSTDGGSTWSYGASLPLTSNTIGALSLYVINTSTIIVGTSNNSSDGEFFKSTDGGSTWSVEVESCIADTPVNSLYFVDANTGYAVGISGMICKTTNGGAVWSSVSTSTVTFRGLYFSDANTGWVVGDSGRIYKTTDGGTNWIQQTSGTSNSLNVIKCASATVCWIGGSFSARIFKTTDGGTNWSSQSPPDSYSDYYRSLSVLDTNTVYIAGQYGQIIKSTNGGTNWSTVSPALVGIQAYTAASTYFYDQNVGWMNPSYGTNLYKTTDGGVTWSNIASIAYPFRDMHFISSSTGWAVNRFDDIYKTTNGGTSWTLQRDGSGADSVYADLEVYFLDSNNGWYVGGAAGNIASTTNGGTSWQARTVGSVLWNDIYFTDANTGWIVGDSGNIRKTTDGGSTWTSQTSGTTNRLNSIYCANSNTCWIAGATGKLLGTTNGGSNWNTLTSGTTNNLLDIYFINANVGISVGNKSTVLTTTDGGTTWTNLNVNFGNKREQAGQYESTLIDISASSGNIFISGSYATLIKVVFSYSFSQTLTSSAYDSENAGNIIGQVSWDEDTNLPSGTTVAFSVRTASTAGGLTGAWTDFTNATSGCTKSGGTVTCPGSAIPAALKDGINDKFFQYKITLTSTGVNTATVDNISIQYVVNGPPDFNQAYGTSGVSSTQMVSSGDTNWGKVPISYSVRDTDTNTGSTTPNLVTPSFDYNIGAGWNVITSGYLGASDLSNKSVGTSTYTVHSALWNAKAQIPGNYTTSAQIRVTVNDNEGANNLASSSITLSVLDTKNPTITSSTINAASGFITINTSDDTALQYNMSNTSTLAANGAYAADGSNGSSGSWTSPGVSSTVATTSWTFSGSYPTVYFAVRDAYNNTSTAAAVAPSTPTSTYIKDNSNPPTSDYREFIAWSLYTATTSASFQRYEVWRSTNGTDYSQLTTITNINTNFYTDTSLSSSTTYFYKTRVVDTDGDTSAFSSPVSDKPDGQGGTDVTAPTISVVTIAEVQATWARITWTTDEIANSTIGFSVSPSTSFSNEKASSTAYVTSHNLTVTGLTPNTTYLFRVKSTDVAGNLATDNNGGAGYATTTLGGPTISSVTTEAVTDQGATITWNTDKSADSFVVHSTSLSTLSAGGGTTAGSATRVTASSSGLYQHRVTLSGLTANAKYYYYVKSTDASANLATDTNGNSYYTFNTTQDTNPPVISAVTVVVATRNSAIIGWQTNELSTSQVDVGTSPGSYSITTTLDSTRTINHTVTVTGLSNVTTYYYRVRSKDAQNNEAVSSEASFVTSDVNVVNIGGGGGSGAQDKDTVSPVVSSINVSEAGSFDVKISFDTSEPAIGAAVYGKTSTYGDSVAFQGFNTSHNVRIRRLAPGTTYHFRIEAVDKAGNSGYSEDNVFKTLFIAEQVQDLITLEDASQFQDKLENLIESVLPSIVPPFIGKVDVTDIAETSASILFRSNVPAYGTLAYTPEPDYDPDKANPYDKEINIGEKKETDHKVELTNLTPSTVYHIQARAFVFPGAIGRSKDNSFITKATKIRAEVIRVGNTSADLRWVTLDETSSFIEYRNLATGGIGRKGDEIKTKTHLMTVDNLDPGTAYRFRIFGFDKNNNIVEADPVEFTTKRDLVPPKITSIKIDNALVPGRTDRIQTIVTWKTDEPASSLFYYEEGSGPTGKGLANKIEVADNFVTNHNVVITNMKPATLYRIQVVSVDEAGNRTSSAVQTIITPRQAESILDIITKNFEDTFKFLKEIR